MALRRTTEELTLDLLRHLYEHTEGRPEWRTLVTNKTGRAAVDFAVERGWMLVDTGQGVCVTEAGRAEVTKRFS